MADTYGIQKLLGKKGFSGPLFDINPANGSVMLDDDGVTVIYKKRKDGTNYNAFYSVQADIDDVYFLADITIKGWKSKSDFLKKRAPLVNIIYHINDSDEILDEDNKIVTPGTYSTYFAKDVVKTNGNCEQWKAIEFALSLTGAASYQASFPVSFASSEGFSTSQITQTNIDNTNAS